MSCKIRRRCVFVATLFSLFFYVSLTGLCRATCLVPNPLLSFFIVSSFLIFSRKILDKNTKAKTERTEKETSNTERSIEFFVFTQT